MLTRWQAVLIATDEWWATLITGQLDITLSTIAGMRRQHQPWKALAWALNTLFPGHTKRARQHDRQRAEAMDQELRRP